MEGEGEGEEEEEGVQQRTTMRQCM